MGDGGGPGARRNFLDRGRELTPYSRLQRGGPAALMRVTTCRRENSCIDTCPSGSDDGAGIEDYPLGSVRCSSRMQAIRVAASFARRQRQR